MLRQYRVPYYLGNQKPVPLIPSPLILVTQKNLIFIGFIIVIVYICTFNYSNNHNLNPTTMKKLIFTLFMSLMAFCSHAQSTLFGDVNGDGNVTVADAMMVVNIIKNGYAPFSVEPTTVSLRVDGTATLEIQGGYDTYEVISANPAVVEASLNGTTITLTAISNGDTKVTVKDVKTQRIVEIPVVVEYNSSISYFTCPDDLHPHLIDLGLPSGTKWACCNVDTDYPQKQSPTNYGGYYAWGETETRSTYDWSYYTHCDNESKDECHNLGDDISGTEYDVAHVKWGGSWVMPTKEQQDELRKKCTFEWTTENGVNGGKFTSENGASIFLPAAGYHNGDNFNAEGTYGWYWSSTQSPSYSFEACYLGFLSSNVVPYYYDRKTGLTVRPVVSAPVVIADLHLSSAALSIAKGERGFVEITSGSGHYSAQSSNETVATVEIYENGVFVKALAVGTATITVTDTKSNQTATVEVTVKIPDLLLDLEELSVTKGQITTFGIYSGSGHYSVQSSDDNVATAYIDGDDITIIPQGLGTATITVTDTMSNQTATVEVTVRAGSY
jgi:hypothetical protein